MSMNSTLSTFIKDAVDLTNYQNLTSEYKDRNDALILTCDKGNLGTVNNLIEEGANPNARDNKSMSKYVSRYKEFISDGLSGLTEVTATHWIDNLKTRIQEAKLDSNKKLTRRDFNFRNLYWGFYPRLIGIIPMRTVFWGSQKMSNDYLKQFNFNNNYKYFIAGLFSGSVQTLIDNPIEAMKISLITSKNKKIKTNLFTGFTPTLLRNSVFCGVFNIVVKNNEDSHKLVAGGLGGIIASIVSHPFDVVKTEMQKAGTNTKNSILFVRQNLIKNPKIFLSGIVPRTLLSLSTMSTGYFSFNFFIDML